MSHDLHVEEALRSMPPICLNFSTASTTKPTTITKRIEQPNEHQQQSEMYNYTFGPKFGPPHSATWHPETTRTCSWLFLGTSWSLLSRSLAALGQPLGRSRRLLGCSWDALGRLLAALGVLLGALGPLLERHAKIMHKLALTMTDLDPTNSSKMTPESIPKLQGRSVGLAVQAWTVWAVWLA